mgnify:CR=1 FL=1
MVERDAVRSQIDRFGDRVPYRLNGLVRQAVNEVEVHARKARLAARLDSVTDHL